ncbi:MAG: GNAT family N-acyltransferase, partial [Rhodothermales bacterium]
MKSLTELLGSHRLVVVPPSRTSDGRYVEASCPLDIEHRAVIDQVQRFRGRIYVDDGALPPDALDRFGRHYSDFDDSCHHLLVVDDQDAVEGCVRIRFYRNAPQPEDLHLWKSVADAPQTFAADGSPATFRRDVISAHIDRAFDQRGSLIEIGGFAVDERIRRSGKAIVLAAGCWSITRALVPSLGVALVTSRHGFNRILKRLGGFELGCGNGDVDGNGNGNGDASRDSDIHPLSFFDRRYGCNVD